MHFQGKPKKLMIIKKNVFRAGILFIWDTLFDIYLVHFHQFVYLTFHGFIFFSGMLSYLNHLMPLVSSIPMWKRNTHKTPTSVGSHQNCWPEGSIKFIPWIAIEEKSSWLSGSTISRYYDHRKKTKIFA